MKNNETVIKTEVVYNFTIIEYFKNGCFREINYKDSMRTIRHSENYYNKYYQNHRDGDLPAYINYSYDGYIRLVNYYKNSKLHRIEGPAVINYDIDGNIVNREYYINGRFMKRQKWLKHPERIKYLQEKNLRNNLKVFLDES